MKIFLDFDDVLFNTRAFIEDMKGVFEECGISKELYQTAYREVKIGFDQGERTYDFDAHIKKLQQYCSFDETKLRDKIQTFIGNGKRFLFPDTENFLFSCKKDNCLLFILSFGTSDFQRAKIVGTGIEAFVENIIITPDNKVDHLRRTVGNENSGVWFFDDRVKYLEGVKRAFPMVKTVFVKRVEGRYHDESNEFCDYVVSSLAEGEKIITEQVHIS